MNHYNDRMKICFYSAGNSLQGGAELCQVLLVEHFISQGHDVHVVLPKAGELSAHYESVGAKVHLLYWQQLQTLSDPLHVLKYMLFLPIIIIRLALLLRRIRCDLLHTNEVLDFQGLVAARLAFVPALTYVRIILPNRSLRWIVGRIALILANRVVCVSRAVHHLALFDSKSPKIRVIYDGGPELDKFDPDTVAPVRPAGCEGKLVVGVVAKMVREKGHLLLVEAARRLRDRGYDQLRYVIVGGSVPRHEPYEQELRDTITRYGLKDIFTLVGQQKNIPVYLAGMDIVCHLPLVEDCFPAVPMEAAVMRKPVVSFIAGGIPEQLTSPTSARLVAIGDVDALVEQLIDLIDNPETRAALGAAGRDEITTKFSLDRHLSELKRVYAELLTGGKDPTRRPRVMRVFYSLKTGGAELQAIRILARIHNDIDIDLVTLTGQADPALTEHAADLNTHSLGLDGPGFAPWRILRTWWRLIRLARKLRPDVVHSSLLWPNLLVTLAGRFMGCPVWLMRHGMDDQLPGGKALSDYARTARLIYRLGGRPRLWAISPSVARFTGDLLNVPAGDVVVIPNGVEIPAQPRAAHSGGPVILVMTGRLVEVKNHLLAVRTLAHLSERGFACELHLAGEGPMQDRIQSLAKELQIESKVHFLGNLDGVDELLATSDVLLQPSTSEGLGNSVLEAMAHGLSVVASDLDGLRDIQDYTGTLTLVPVGDQDAFNEAVEAFVADPARIDRQGLANRQSVQKELSMAQTAAKWVKAYREVFLGKAAKLLSK